MNEKNIHPCYGTLNLDDDSCFLCGSKNGDITREHVFPKWLLNKFNLFNAKLTLLNGTLFPYRALTVPCCIECNGTHLSKLEGRVRRAVIVENNLDKLSDLDIYLWVGKIFYGVLRKEINLSLNLKDRSLPSIFPKEALAKFDNLHRFLQIIRGKYEIIDEGPFSVLRANLIDFGNNNSFDFHDDFDSFAAGIRLGNISFIVAFEDIGLSKSSYGKYLDKVKSYSLHPLQFEEVYAKVAYQLTLMGFGTSFMTSTHVNGERRGVINTILPISPTGVLPMSPWVQEEFAKRFFKHASRWMSKTLTFDSFFNPPDLVQTWMNDVNGNLLIFLDGKWRKLLNKSNNTDTASSAGT